MVYLLKHPPPLHFMTPNQSEPEFMPFKMMCNDVPFPLLLPGEKTLLLQGIEPWSLEATYFQHFSTKLLQCSSPKGLMNASSTGGDHSLVINAHCPLKALREFVSRFQIHPRDRAISWL